MHHLMSLGFCECAYDKKYMQAYLVDISNSSNSFLSTIILRRTPKLFYAQAYIHTYISPTLHDLDQWPKVHSMHLGLKISSVDLAFLSACRCGYTYPLPYWCNKLQVSTHDSFNLHTSDVRQPSALAYT